MSKLGIWHNGKYHPPIAGGAPGLLEQLATEIAAARGGQAGTFFRDTPSTPSTPYYTGPNSLFGVAGLERDVISSRIQPMGLADRLPALATNVVQPVFAYLTGFQADSGSEPNGVCDDPPTAGPGKSCFQIAQLGRFSRLTRTLEVNRLGAQINRGEFMDLRFMNDPLSGAGAMSVPASIPAAVRLRNEVTMRMIEVGISFQNWMTHKLYTGNPANNTGGDGYREFPGLDILVNTGHVDAYTAQTCPALDSDIKDFNYGRLGAGTADGDIYTALSYMLRYLRWNAEQMNFGQVNWAIVMRPALFWELTAAWPCTYLTYRCNTQGNAGSVVVDATDQVRMRDDMRNGNYIMVDGIRYPVVLDTQIPEDTNTTNNRVQSGAFASDIYILPMTVRGGVPVLYWEHFDFRTSMSILGDSTYYWTDDGKFLWHRRPPTNWCVDWLAKIEPRIILKTPQLAGRLQNVAYMPLQHERDPWTTDPYFADGGVSTGRAVPEKYAQWSPVNTNGA
jgi:hypothetical protein